MRGTNLTGEESEILLIFKNIVHETLNRLDIPNTLRSLTIHFINNKYHNLLIINESYVLKFPFYNGVINCWL